MKEIFTIKKISVCIIFIGILLQFSCAKKENTTYFLVKGDAANAVELSTITDLKKDLSKVVSGEVLIVSESEELPDSGIIIILGTIQSNGLIAEMTKKKTLQLSEHIPGLRGGIWQKVNLSDGQKGIVIAGSDVAGLQYSIYDYAQQVLGVDPLEYWTGKVPEKDNIVDVYNFENKTIAPPKVPILAYFENDVDELANYRGKLLEYDWESYTEMINSLVRLRYNAIQFFDMLGRPEFFTRPEYKSLSPDYQIDVDYLNKMIDYAHEKGMQIQIDFELGYQLHPMDEKKAECWSTYKEDWIAAWKYYLEKTPLSKTDIFVLRPRNQVWDWEYKSSCGESKIDVFNDVYEVFGKLVDEYKPGATKVVVCYSDGMEMFNEGFNPPEDWIVAWSDHGFGDFKHHPKDTKGYAFGTYMHAGYWSNHTVHNPYPNKVEAVMKGMFQEYEADKYCLVNGQNFRPFLLNLEAYSAVCNNPDTFNGDDFYKTWTERYFNKESAKHAVFSMKYLNKAQEGRKGYVEHLWEIREAVAYLSNAPIRRPGKTPVPFTYERVANDLENTKLVQLNLSKAVEEAEIGLLVKDSTDNFYHAYVYLPAVLYSDLIAFETTLHRMAVLKREFETTKDVKFLEEAKNLIPVVIKELEVIYKHRADGDLDEKWKDWYAIKNRRQNNGFPTMKMIEDIEDNLNKL